MTITIYLDLEFTDLQQNANIISLALLSENNKALYIETSSFNYHTFDCAVDNKFVRTNVLPKLLLFSKKELSLSYPNIKYVEIEDLNILEFTKDNITKWKKETVETDRGMASIIHNWLLQFEQEVQIVVDCGSYDWVLFCNIFGGALNIPSYISPVPSDLNNYISYSFDILDKFAFNVPREKLAAGYKFYLASNKGELKLSDYPSVNMEEGFFNNDYKHNSLWDVVVLQQCYKKCSNLNT